MRTTPGPCPKCGSNRTRQVGETISPPSIARKCDGCGHMWVDDPPARANGRAKPDACPKCGSGLLDVGAPSHVATYLRCAACKHLVVVPPRARR